MSVPMRKHPTETIVVGRTRFQVPKTTAKAMLILLKGAIGVDDDMIRAEESETLKKLDQKYTRAGACLQGSRFKEGLSQVELANKLGIPQTNVSAMELGKRPIGKKMAHRLAKVLNINYRVFL